MVFFAPPNGVGPSTLWYLIQVLAPLNSWEFLLALFYHFFFPFLVSCPFVFFLFRSTLFDEVQPIFFSGRVLYFSSFSVLVVAPPPPPSVVLKASIERGWCCMAPTFFFFWTPVFSSLISGGRGKFSPPFFCLSPCLFWGPTTAFGVVSISEIVLVCPLWI